MINAIELMAAYQSGMSATAIAKHFGTSPQTVLRRLKAAGIKLRQHGYWCKGVAPAPIDHERLQQLTANGMTCREMGPLLGVSEECVRERMKKLGIPRLPPKCRPGHNASWKGGRIQDEDGYFLRWCPNHPSAALNGYVREHRLVMEGVLGRYLTRIEVVDHIDGNKSNNDPSNLRVFDNNTEHLKATLRGRCPRWSEDGKARIQARRLSQRR